MTVNDACRVDLLGLLPLFRHREVDELSQLPVLGPLLAVDLLEEALAVALVVLVCSLEHVTGLAEHVRALAVLHSINPLTFVSAIMNKLFFLLINLKYTRSFKSMHPRFM